MFYITFFNDSFISHRSAFVKEFISFSQALYKTKRNFIYGHYHAHSLHSKYIFITIMISSLVILYKKIIDRKFIFIFVLIMFSSAAYGFIDWKLFENVINEFSILKAFRWERFHWLHPLLWHLCFFIALSYITKYFTKIYLFVYFILLLQIFYLFSYKDSIHHYYGSSPITYNQFFSSIQMKEIESFIGKEKSEYRVGSIGLYPSIPQKAGFFTIDAYASSYPLEQKIRFREIIENELNKNKENADYFDNWGGRCYLFIDELNRNSVMKNNNQVINNLNLNYKKLKNMNCQYLLSAVKIENISEKELKFEKVFKDKESYWDIFLYKIQ